MIKKKPKRPRIAPFLFTFCYTEIKKQDLFFAVSYSEPGTPGNYTDILHFSEVQKPESLFLEVQKIAVFKNDKVRKTLTKPEAEKLILLLDHHNKKSQNEKQPKSTN